LPKFHRKRGNDQHWFGTRVQSMAQKNQGFSSPAANSVVSDLEGGGFDPTPVVLLNKFGANSVAISIGDELRAGRR
jgi:hypothetical protein